MTTRKGAFDPERLNELDDLLAPPTAILMQSTAAPPTPPHPAAAATRPSEALDPRKASRVPVSPSRPTARAARTPEPSGERSIVTVTARIQRGLYEQLSETLVRLNERPSYAQIVAWTCRDHPAEVLDAITGAAYQADNAFRGRRPAASTVLIAPRFRPSEMGALDQIIMSAAERLGATPTRTAAIDAAIRTAIRTGVPGLPAGADW